MNIDNIERYIRLMRWAIARYTRNGELIAAVGGKPSRFTCIERMAYATYMRGSRP